MAFLPRPVTRMMLSTPDATASSTPYWMIGLSTSGNISFGWALVAGRKRVPSPAAGNTALQTFIVIHWPLNPMNSFRCRFCLKRRAVISQHCLADNFQRDPALLHEPVVKLQQAEILPAHFLIVRPQFKDLQLAERVDEISGIGSAALGFQFRNRRRLIAFLHEELLCLLNRHVAGVHLNAD